MRIMTPVLRPPPSALMMRGAIGDHLVAQPAMHVDGDLLPMVPLGRKPRLLPKARRRAAHRLTVGLPSLLVAHFGVGHRLHAGRGLGLGFVEVDERFCGVSFSCATIAAR
jgi:hypothetical protein